MTLEMKLITALILLVIATWAMIIAKFFDLRDEIRTLEDYTASGIQRVEKIARGEKITGTKIDRKTDSDKTIYPFNYVEVTTTKPVESDVRSYNVGDSDYSKHKTQPWDLWCEYKLNPFDADIVKRVLRHKKTDSRKMDYEKIIHICKERIRQIDSGCDVWAEKEE